MIFWGNGILGASQVSRFLFLKGVSWPCANSLIATSVVKSISSWDDDNPYYFDEQGVKHYACHPDHENLSRCVGNDSPHLCLGCGACFLMDSKVKRNKCPECKSPKVKSQFTLEGCVCPYFKEGEFVADPNNFAIS